MKKFSMYLIMIVILLSTTSIEAQSVNIMRKESKQLLDNFQRTGSGVFSKLPGIMISTITPKGGVFTKRYWLGCTYLYKGREIDLKAVRVRNGQDETLMSIKSSTIFDKLFDGEVTLKNIKWIASLWKKKVKDNCKWCRRNGYHLEGRVHTSTWTY